MNKIIEKLKEAAAAKRAEDAGQTKTRNVATPTFPKIDMEKLKKAAAAKNMKSAVVNEGAAAKLKEIMDRAKKAAAEKVNAEGTVTEEPVEE